MSFRKLCIALGAICVLGAAFANSAFAGVAVEDPSAWVKTNNGVKETIAESNINCGVTEGAVFTLKSKVLGAAMELTATGLNCTGAKIKTTGSGSTSKAIAEGQIEFTGVSVMAPAGCKTPATNKTQPLDAVLKMDSVETAKTYVDFTPVTPEKFTDIKLEGCAAAGTYPVKGTVIGEATDPTGTHTVKQEVAGNETTHAMSSLKVGSEPATLTGEFWVELESGALWGAEGL
jgi:hypothetical protein